jgi:parallel beta-helix repeat protein
VQKALNEKQDITTIHCRRRKERMKKTFSLLILAILLTSIFSALSKIQTAKAGTIVVPDNYPTIQAAINAASSGDTIYVKVGTYHENVFVNKAVSIVGENKNTTIIDGGKSNTITVKADNVTISDFTIRNGWSGIYSNGYDRMTIEENIVTANIGTGVGDGIYIMNSYGDIIGNNIITGNTEDGLTLAPNTTDSIVSENIIVLNGGTGVFMHDHADRNTIIDNNVSLNSEHGVYMAKVYDNHVYRNCIRSNKVGFTIHGGTRNIIEDNSVVSNVEAGFRLLQDSIPTADNEFYHNDIGNNVQVQDFTQSKNTWNNGYPSGGNYWADYVDVDEKRGPDQNRLGCDGIWDHTRIIGNYSQDMYPLVRPWANLIVPDDYPTIQAAINAANPGDTIYVKAAAYYETINVEKTVTLRGENRDTTIIDGGGNQNVVFVTADNVTIIGFTIRNSGVINPGGYGGIGVSGADHVIVENNNLVSNDDGIWIYDSNYDSFANNNFSYNVKAGVYTRYASGMIIADNIVANNDWGIVLRTGTDTSTVADNSVYSNGYSGIQVGPESELNTIICNTVTHNDYGITVFAPGNNVFSDNNVSSSKYDGIGLQETTNNTVTRNILTGNKESGIAVYYADGNTFNCNKIMYNGSPAVSAGVYLESSYNNVFYHNELIANTQSQVYSSNSINSWNTSYPSGGNYWSDYTDVDEKSGQNQDQPGSDGIWDHPYFIDGYNLDNYPLVSPWTPWGDWQHYHDYSEIVNTLFYLNDQYPNIAELFSIGKSYEGKDIYCLKLTNETNIYPKPKVFFVGYHHARELISAELPLYFAVEATTGFGSDPAITRMLNYSEVYIVPALNVDGFEVVKKNEWQRKNAYPYDEDNDTLLDEDPPIDTDGDGMVAHLYFDNGTYYYDIKYEGIDTDGDGKLDWVGGADLNRNYGYQWNAPCYSGSSNMSAEDYRGRAPFSEPETQTVRDLELRHNFDYAVSFHSGTQLVLCPWVYTTNPTPDDPIFREVASNLSALVGVPYAQGSALYTASGTWGDWMYGNGNTLAFECEVFQNSSAGQTWPGPEPNTWWEKGVFQFFNPDPSQIETVIQRWLPVFTYTTNRAITEAYDITTTNVTPLKTVVGQGYSMRTNITVTNRGDFSETFNVTLYANTTAIATQTITLTSGNSTTVTFTWNTSGFAKGNYTINAVADVVQGETSTADNNFTDGWVFVSMLGDLTNYKLWPFVPDGKSDGSDLIVCSRCYGSNPTSPWPLKWDPNCDITNDNKIDGSDLIIVAHAYGTKDP